MNMQVIDARAYYAPPDGNDIPKFSPGTAIPIAWLGRNIPGDLLPVSLPKNPTVLASKRRIFIAVTFAGSGETIYDWPAIERMDGPAS